MLNLTLFTKRRLVRLASALVLAVAFALLQYWQSGDRRISPVIGAATSTSGSVTNSSGVDSTEFFIYRSATTTGVLAHVTRDVDGDTIEVKITSTGEAAKVRFLGMNTPESVDPRRPVQCFGKEASHFTKSLIEDKDVLLLDDPKADDRDKYGRLLRTIVRASDFLDVNATLVNAGYANAYLSFPLDAKRKAQIRRLEAAAKAGQRGLWSPDTCDGKK